MALEPFVGPWPLFQLLDLLYTAGRTPWTRDQPIARPLPAYSTTQTEYMHTDIHDSSGIQTHDPSIWVGEDGSCLRLRSHCDQLTALLHTLNYFPTQSPWRFRHLYVSCDEFLYACVIEMCHQSIQPVFNLLLHRYAYACLPKTASSVWTRENHLESGPNCSEDGKTNIPSSVSK
jgi:hypothetical protein